MNYRVTFHPFCRYKRVNDLPKSASWILNQLRENRVNLSVSGDIDTGKVEIFDNQPDQYKGDLISNRFYIISDGQPLTFNIDHINQTIDLR